MGSCISCFFTKNYPCNKKIYYAEISNKYKYSIPVQQIKQDNDYYKIDI